MNTHINQISVATGDHECHGEFLDFIPRWLGEGSLLRRLRDISRQSAIYKRYSMAPNLFCAEEAGTSLYGDHEKAGTSLRMEHYRRHALPLALKALAGLDTRGITDLVVVSCTGYYSPGLDLELAQSLGLGSSVRRTLVGHMGCNAAMPALRMATDAVRANPKARVLVVCVELCSLHLQRHAPLDHWIASLLFSDGCAAAIVSAEELGPRIAAFHTQIIANSRDDMRWAIGDDGFTMSLAQDVPAKIALAMHTHARDICCGLDPATIRRWAVHPGGRKILDELETALALPAEGLASSRKVLAECGNMSSATVLFVLKDLLEKSEPGETGLAMAFGPGLCVESMLWRA